MIVYNNETIKNAIMDALDKMERGIEISEVDRNELINAILKHGDRNFGIKNKDTGKYYTEEELQYSVYIHIINENNKCYIGQTSQNPKDRWGRNGKGYEGQVFHNPIKYYGWDNISHIVLCHGLNKEQVNEIEVALISLFKSTNREEFGYNVENGGNGKGKVSEETRNKMSEAHKGEKHPMYNKHHSEETRNKMSDALKGKHTGENNPMYNKHHSEETRKKMSEVKKGKYTGENNPKAKKVCCDKMIFTTAKECAKFYNVNYNTMLAWLLGRRKTPSEFIELGLRYATQEDIEKYPLYIKEEQNQQN